LGGAVEFTLCHLIFSILRDLGEGLGTFGAGVLVGFYDTVEPNLVAMTKPLIDWFLAMPSMPTELRNWLTLLKNPTSEAGAMLLQSVAGQAMSSVGSTVFGAVLSPVTFGLNRVLHPGRPSPGDLWAMSWRDSSFNQVRTDYFGDLGFTGDVQTRFAEIVRPRSDVGTMLASFYRGTLSDAELKGELGRRGYIAQDVSNFLSASRAILADGDLIRAYLRGLSTKEATKAEMQRKGFTAEDADKVLTMAWWIPGPSDMVRMAVREAWSDDVCGRFGYDQDFPAQFASQLLLTGGSADWAKRYWRAHWELPSPTMGYEMLHRGVIDTATLDTLLRVADFAPYWRPKMMAISYNPLTRVDVRRMYGLGILDRAGVKKAYKDATLAVFRQAFQEDLISRTDLQAKMSLMGYDTADANLMLALEDAKKTLGKKSSIGQAYQADIKAIVERGYSSGLIPWGTCAQMLGALQYTSEEIGLVLQAAEYARQDNMRASELHAIEIPYTSRRITPTEASIALGRLGISGLQASRLMDTWNVARDIPTSRLTEAQYRKALEFGILTLDDYENAMYGLGYHSSDVAILKEMAKAYIA
jgi:hypothetical protein